MSVSLLSRRALGALAATSLLVGLLPAAATAATPEKRDITQFACPPGEVPDPGFEDDDTTTEEHQASIACVVWYELAAGRTSTTYAPGDAVNRGQMATFIGNLLVEGGVTLPSNPEDAFEDDDNTTHETRINQLAALGVVDGFDDGEYKPRVAVTRAQMASFLNRAYEEITGAPLTSSEDFFTDDEGAFHEDNINAVAAAGIAAGKTATTYAPGEAVKRDQMATFLARETDLLVEKGEITKPPAADVKLNSASVQQGGKVTGEIATGPGVTLTSAKVSGCGLTDQALTLVGENNAFDVTIPATQPTGACTLTFTMTRESGANITDVEGITVTGVTSETSRPELVSVSGAPATAEATTVTMKFTFDETLNAGSPPIASDFALYDASAERRSGMTDQAPTVSGSTVSVVFSREAYDAATTAVASFAAVEDQQNLGNPEGSVALKTSSTNTSVTEAPDLIDVVAADDPKRTKVASATETWTFAFDEPAYRVGAAADFHLVLADGTVVDGTSGAGQAPTTNPSCPDSPECSRDITFDLTGHVGKAVVRGTIDQGTVSDNAADTDAVQTSGNLNPQQAEDVSGGGATPYLTDITIDTESNKVTYVFNRGVSVVDTSGLPGEQTGGRFRAYRADGSEVTNSSASASGNTVVATFTAGIDGEDPLPTSTVGASADQDAVQATSGNNATNRVDERAKPQAFVAGRTAAPDLTAVQRSVSGNNSRLTFFFDQPVATSDDTTGALVIYQQDGQRTTLRLNHPLTNECETSGSTVICEASSTSTLGQLIDSAVLGGAERATVEDSTGSHRNYESTVGIAG